MFTDGWEKDWHVANGDEQLSRKLIPVFEAYLNDLHQKGVSKSTQVSDLIYLADFLENMTRTQPIVC